jgi:hypothetical protein
LASTVPVDRDEKSRVLSYISIGMKKKLANAKEKRWKIRNTRYGALVAEYFSDSILLCNS